MRLRPSPADDALFIVALAAVLAGTGLLLRTTGVLPFGDFLWPLLVMTAGGALLYLAIVRAFPELLLAAGTFFCLAGFILLLSALAGWGLIHSWPLLMSAAGLAWYVYGWRHLRRIKASFAIPALGFFGLGLFFSLFSFDIVGISLGRFIALWWPSVLIAGGAFLFGAYGIKSRTRRGRRRPPSS